MSFSQPNYDAYGTAVQQQGFNKSAAQDQQKLNMVNQQTPYGSLNYAADPNAPSGYSANVQLTPQQQTLLDQLQGSKTNVGAAAQSLTGSFGSLYGQPPNIDPSTLTNKMMGWGHDYMQPIFDQQQSNLDAKLRNQGIAPGSAAWDNAQNLQSRNVNNAYTNLMLQAEPTAFSQAMQEYNLPLQTAYGLMGQGAPGSPSFQTTPQGQIAPANYMQSAQYGANLQQQQFNQTMEGMGQLAGAAMGMPGMFGGGWGGGGGGGGGGMYNTFQNGMYVPTF